MTAIILLLVMLTWVLTFSKVVFVRFLSGKVTTFPFLFSTLVLSPHSRGGELSFWRKRLLSF